MTPSAAATPGSSWVWVDFENTPQVLFLEPIIRTLQKRGWPTRLSAKPQSQTLELAGALGLPVESIGGGDFVGMVGKVAGTLRRAWALSRWATASSERPAPRLLVSCSRSAVLAGRLLGVPGVGLLDYEHAAIGAFALNRVLWLPDLLHDVSWAAWVKRIARFYPGLKENLYLDTATIDRAGERLRLRVAQTDYLVVARPPAVAAHYAAHDAERVWVDAIRRVLDWPSARVLVSARDSRQRATLGAVLPAHPRLEFLEHVVPGPSLVAAADLVIGGGGTMNREAAVLGVPAWSTFLGEAARIDDRLAREGRLRWVRDPQAVVSAVAAGPPQRREPRGPYPDGLKMICEDILTRLEAPSGTVTLVPHVRS